MTKIIQQATIKTNNRKDSICTINIQAIKFADLWAAYPNGDLYLDPETGAPPKGYENQCAIKLSASIHGAGVEMKSFKSATITIEGRRLAIRAKELASWLKLQPFCGLPTRPENITGKDWQERVRGKTGITFFGDYWLRPGEKLPSGDHIDLWNGNRLSPGWTSFIRFSLGFSSASIFDISDLGNSKEILFWQMK